METFLKKTAEYLLANYKDNLEDILLVLPNKRAGLFLKNEFSQLISHPIWLPQIIGTQDFVEKVAAIEIADNLQQLFELYQTYCNIEPTPENFEDFSKWGQIILHDFNEIDRYLINVETFFKEINDIRAIEVWNVGQTEPTELQTQYLVFWQQLSQLYQQFNKDLEVKKLAYQGRAFRTVAEQLQANPEAFIQKHLNKWKKIVFIGFNALTTAEESIITSLIKQQRAEIIWDADEYYLKDEMQESGYFLRQHFKKNVFSNPKWIHDKFSTTKKHISIIGIPQQVGQAKYLPELLKDLKTDNNYKNTAVVLADENLLIPVMQSIPNEVDNVNITMGYPLRNSGVTIFFETLFSLFMNGEKFGKKSQLTFHYKDFLNLFRLPFTNIVVGQKNGKKISSQIIKNNWVFINSEKLSLINETLPLNFNNQTTPIELIGFCKHIIQIAKNYYLDNQSLSRAFTLELEYLFHFSKLFNQLELLMTNYHSVSSFKGLFSLFRQLLSTFSIELYGEPLQGLQIMGMLETRNIDFENVILLGANEGILPQGKSFNSFIPYDLKKAYRLPTHYEKDAVYAYHFYRLIQNAKNIFITYSTETNEFGSGEKSRFITQIEHELHQLPNITISNKIINYTTKGALSEEKAIEKNEAIIKSVKTLFATKISPSAINTYLNCPLDFYYKYVLKISEEEEVEDVIEHTTFGNIVHKVLEELYKEHLNKELFPQHVKTMLELADDLVFEQFRLQYNTNEIQQGKNLLIFNVAKTYVRNFLTQELTFLEELKQPIVILGLEEQLNYQTSITVNGEDIPIIFAGIIDRIDRVNNQIRIIDYKTGLVEPKDLKFSDFKEIEEQALTKVNQVLFYALLLQHNHPQHIESPLTAGMISFRKISEGLICLTQDKNKTVTTEMIKQFEELLKSITAKIIDKNLPFKHNSDADYCNFC